MPMSVKQYTSAEPSLSDFYILDISVDFILCFESRAVYSTLLDVLDAVQDLVNYAPNFEDDCQGFRLCLFAEDVCQ